MDPPSLRDKRLLRELPLLPYKTEWNVGENVVLVPENKLTIHVSSWYPFRCPTVEFNGEPENVYFDKFAVSKESRRRIRDDWCPCYGIKEIVDDFLKEQMIIMATKVEDHASNGPA
jgi:hypothetical protein